MKKLWILLLCLALSALLCGCGSLQLAECFDEATVNAEAENVAMLVVSRDYQAICDRFRADIRGSLTPEYLAEQLDGMMDASGDLVRLRGSACVGQKNADGTEDFAMAIVLGKFENGKRTFTISFDKDMELVGLYVK